MANPWVSARTFRFLKEIAAHNERAWFAANKQRYIDEVRDPLLEFVREFEPRLEKVSSQFIADARPNGGSLFRVYRDTRFAKDKSPYKTHAGLSFRHHAARDMPAPSFYLNLEPGRIFAAAGLWHPRSEPLRQVREAIVAKPQRWKRLSRSLDDRYDTLKRVPRGFDPDHPLADDLKRKSYTLSTSFTQAQACAPDFMKRYAQACRTAGPLMEFLCDAVGVEW